MDENKTDRSETKNMFSEVLNDRYAKCFDKIHKSDLKDSDDLMKQLHEDSKTDESLTDEQKKIINTCVLAYNQATGKGNVSIPIIAFLKNEKPNTYKVANKETRVKRMFEQLQTFVDSTGFDNSIMSLTDNMLGITQLTNMYGEETGNYIIKACIHNIAALTAYSRKLDEEHIATKWYLICYLKFIKEISNNIYNRDFVTANYTRISSFLRTFNFIFYLSYENAGKLDELKDIKRNVGDEFKLNDGQTEEIQKEIQENTEDNRETPVRGQESSVADNDVSMGKFKELDEKLAAEKEKYNITEVEV